MKQILARLAQVSAFRGVALGAATTIALLIAAQYLTDPAARLRFAPLLVGILLWVWVTFSFRRARYFRRFALPRYSMRTLLLFIGLGFCLAVLWRDGVAWRSVHTIPGHSPMVTMSPDGRWIATIANSTDPPIEIRDTYTGALRATIRHPWIQPATNLAFSADGNQLLTLTTDRSGPPTNTTARLLDSETGEVIRSWTSRRPGRISARGDRFFLYSMSARPDEVSVYQTDSNEPLLTVQRTSASGTHMFDTISETGRYLLIFEPVGCVQVWDVEKKQLHGKITDGAIDPKRTQLVNAKFSPDDRYVAIATTTGVDIWDVQSLTKTGSWQPPGFGSLNAIEWSPTSDRYLANYFERTGATTGRNYSYIVSLQGRALASLQGSFGSFSPRGDQLAAQYGIVSILDGYNGRTLANLGRPPGYPHTAAFVPGQRTFYFSPDGEWLLRNGGAAVWHRQRSERWYGVLSLPAFWGADLFLIALLLPLVHRTFPVVRENAPATSHT